MSILDKITGRVKQAAGDLADDASLRREGRQEERKGEAKEERAIEFYRLISSFDFMCSTPTLFNAGTTRPQLSSCFLTTVPDDLSAIFGAIKDNALLAKYSGGLDVVRHRHPVGGGDADQRSAAHAQPPDRVRDLLGRRSQPLPGDGGVRGDNPVQAELEGEVRDGEHVLVGTSPAPVRRSRGAPRVRASVSRIEALGFPNTMAATLLRLSPAPDTG